MTSRKVIECGFRGCKLTQLLVFEKNVPTILNGTDVEPPKFYLELVSVDLFGELWQRSFQCYQHRL
jgi:hypothetical protein